MEIVDNTGFRDEEWDRICEEEDASVYAHRDFGDENDSRPEDLFYDTEPEEARE